MMFGLKNGGLSGGCFGVLVFLENVCSNPFIGQDMVRFTRDWSAIECLEEVLQSRVNNRRDTEPKVYQKNANIIQLIRAYSLKIFSQTAIHAS